MGPCEQQCKDCQYYDGRTMINDRGICRRYPPHKDYHFPCVSPFDWCGEFIKAATLGKMNGTTINNPNGHSEKS